MTSNNADERREAPGFVKLAVETVDDLAESFALLRFIRVQQQPLVVFAAGHFSFDRDLGR